MNTMFCYTFANKYKNTVSNIKILLDDGNINQITDICNSENYISFYCDIKLTYERILIESFDILYWISVENLLNTHFDNIFCFDCDIWNNDDYTKEMMYDVNNEHYENTIYNPYARSGYKIFKCIENEHIKCLEHIYNQHNTNKKIDISINGYGELEKELNKSSNDEIKKYIRDYFFVKF